MSPPEAGLSAWLSERHPLAVRPLPPSRSLPSCLVIALVSVGHGWWPFSWNVSLCGAAGSGTGQVRCPCVPLSWPLGATLGRLEAEGLVAQIAL